MQTDKEVQDLYNTAEALIKQANELAASQSWVIEHIEEQSSAFIEYVIKLLFWPDGSYLDWHKTIANILINQVQRPMVQNRKILKPDVLIRSLVLYASIEPHQDVESLTVDQFNRWFIHEVQDVIGLNSIGSDAYLTKAKEYTEDRTLKVFWQFIDAIVPLAITNKLDKNTVFDLCNTQLADCELI